MPTLELVSHHLCPYVQRAAIVLAEKGVPFTRTYIDLANKPDWFLRISPLGKVPLLKVGDEVLFESAVICEYLDETAEPRLHPADPLERARHRAWMEFGSAILNDIGGFYSAPNAEAFQTKITALSDKFRRLEEVLSTNPNRDGPYFAGQTFRVVDAVFGPVFRYFDTFETIADFGIFADLPKVSAWRAALAERPSVRNAVTEDYPSRLSTFLRVRNSHLSGLMARAA
ncbi:MAG TPA: glutathione S-transferase family protein [Azospirillaceae bacterium]|nr:glutathione S-transferase family protein [Azospirillaceae bacterium]